MERWWPVQCFVNSGTDGERSWKMGGKSSGKNVLRNPFHNLLEKLLCGWPLPTVSTGLLLGTKEVKDRRTPTCLGNSYEGAAGSGVFGTHWGVAPARVPHCTHLCLPVTGGLRKQEIRHCKGIKILLFICPSSHRGEDFLLLTSSGIWDWVVWAFCWICFCCPHFQHAGLPVTSPVLGFHCFQLLQYEFSAVLCLCLMGAKPGLLQPGYIQVMAQQRFEMVDQCYSSITAQSFIQKTKDSIPSRCESGPIPKEGYAEHTMQNAGLDESPVGIKIARRNITLMTENEEELLMRVKENEKAVLKLSIQKLRSWQLIPSLLGK